MKKTIRLPKRLFSALVGETKIEVQRSLMPGKTRAEVVELMRCELGKRLLFMAGVAMVCLGAGGVLLLNRETKSTVTRPSPGEKSCEQTVLVNIDGEWKEWQWEISAQEYGAEEIEQLHKEAEAYLDKCVLNGNESFSRITKSLNFPETVLSGCKVSWSTDVPWVITDSGEVINDDLTESVVVTVTGKIYYGSEYRLYERRLLVEKKEYSETERLEQRIQEELEAINAAGLTSDKVKVPENVAGRKLRLEEEGSRQIGGAMLMLGVLIPCYVWYGFFTHAKEKKQKRERQAVGVYPEFIAKFAILLTAGVSVRQCFERLYKEYKKRYGNTHVLSEELGVLRSELKNGSSEIEAYEAFGQRMGTVAYRRMSALLVQNATKGIQGLSALLLAEAKEVTEEEKTKVRIRGEQTGTKLLLPMMGFLLLVFAVLLVPAFQMF